MKNFFKDFKAFIAKGNILNLAVGMVIGSAFTAIVNSFVNDIIMPPIGVVIGGVDFSDLAVVITPEELNEAGEVIKEAVTWNYGSFIQAIINFLIIALCMFLIVKFMMKATGIVSSSKANSYKTILTKEEIKNYKAQGKTSAEMQQIADQKRKAKEAVEAATKAQNELKNNAMKQEVLLNDIRSLLMEQAKEQGKDPKEIVSKETKDYLNSLESKEN